jgi:transposase
LIDEAGLLPLPLIRRSLAPAGQTPVLEHRARHRDKVSLIAALVVSPTARRLRLFFQTYPNAYVNNQRAADFLGGLLQGPLGGRALVVWDGGAMHKGDPIRALLARFSGLTLERFPPYAPELNPVEQLWNHLKHHQLPNFAARDVEELHQTALARLEANRDDYPRLKSYLRASGLPPPESVLLS